MALDRIVMPNPPFLCRFIDSVEELSAADDALALLLAKKSRRDVSLNGVSHSDKYVLILTHDYDPEVTLVTIKLQSRGIQCVRLNTNDIAHEQLRVRYGIGPESSKANIEFTVGQHELDPSRVSAVLLRQFDLKEVNFCGNEVVRAFLFQQWAHAFQILQRNLACEWISNPDATIKSSDRIRQLLAAETIGFDVPPTLITNDSTAAKDFYRLHGGNVVLKALHHHSVLVGGTMYSTYARRMNDSELLMLDENLVGAPCILQKRLVKKSELRVTVIGEKVFAVELGHNFLDDDDIDIHHYLRTNNFPIEKVESLPDRILNGCISLVKSLGLKYGAIDFAIEKDSNRLIFLEINPTGEWYWIESKTGLRMTDAVANLIEDCLQK
jgi:glutathione synthase/RimK-type ligase-like ATP-grasp enzyme